MGQVRHGSATTTHAVRAAIQRSQASIAELSRELGVNPNTTLADLWLVGLRHSDRNADKSDLAV